MPSARTSLRVTCRSASSTGAFSQRSTLAEPSITVSAANGSLSRMTACPSPCGVHAQSGSLSQMRPPGASTPTPPRAGSKRNDDADASPVGASGANRPPGWK